MKKSSLHRVLQNAGCFFENFGKTVPFLTGEGSSFCSVNIYAHVRGFGQPCAVFYVQCRIEFAPNIPRKDSANTKPIKATAIMSCAFAQLALLGGVLLLNAQMSNMMKPIMGI